MMPSGSNIQTGSQNAGISMFTYIAVDKEIKVPQ